MTLKDSRNDKVTPQTSWDIHRHQSKLRRALREQIEEIILSQPVITGNPDKVIQIPVRSLQEFTFQFKDGGGAGKFVEGIPKKAGTKAGQEMIEADIRLQLAIELMMEDLEILDLFRAIEEGERVPRSRTRPWGKKHYGNRARLMKRETVKNKLARVRATKSQSKAFKAEDSRYRHFKETPDGDYRAVIFYIMDISGSMDGRKLYLCRALNYCINQYLRQIYSEVQARFIVHEAKAEEKTEEEFFRTKSNGGTQLSTGTEEALKIIDRDYSNGDWDIYAWHATDGDNSSQDNPMFAKELGKLSEKARAIMLCETDTSIGSASQSDALKELREKVNNFFVFLLDRKEGIRDTLKGMLEVLKERSGVNER
ncbi:MAG: hypothetical protein G01um10143_474 [Parcubacteria group bacterium Gr01-1014_3]|nr:MAG: hypothetical protein G01um10143_474 [Parcubacteria group bacterium Gr01-1014_3]